MTSHRPGGPLRVLATVGPGDGEGARRGPPLVNGSLLLTASLRLGPRMGR